MTNPEYADRRPSRARCATGKYGNDPRATALIVPNLGIIFITQSGVALRTHEDLQKQQREIDSGG